MPPTRFSRRGRGPVVERVLTRLLFGSAEIKIKSFRAVTARATFLCLCKETWRKETHPAFAPDASRRVRGAGGIFRRGILPRRKTPHIHVRRPAGLIRRLRRYGGAPMSRSRATAKGQSLDSSNHCRSGGSRALLISFLIL